MVRRVASTTGRIAVETKNEIMDNDTNRRVAGSLAILGAISTAAEVRGWLSNTDALLEFLQGSGRHLLVGNLGAITGIVASRAESMRARVIAGIAGAAGADFLAELLQSLVVTGAMHHGSLKDILSFLSHKEIFWGNAKDALAAEIAAIPAVFNEPLS